MLRKITVVLVGAALAAFAVSAPTAYGHAEYDHSTPAANAVLPTAPTQVDVYFAEELEPLGSNDLNVTGPGNVEVDNNDATIDALDQTHMTITLQGGLPNGVYTVQWATTSADDGDQAEGAFQFQVGPPPVGGVALDVFGGEDGSSGMAWFAIALAAALAGAAVTAAGAVVVRRGR